MIIDMQQETPSTCYHLLTQTVIPRPIAWVLSLNDDASLNLAPFSFFNAVCSEPPLLMMSIGKKPHGELKDTRRNLISGRDFVVHIASREHAEAVNLSAAVLEYGDSEVAAGDLALAEFPGCELPRLQSCLVAYHCRFYDMHELGPNQQGIIYAEVKQLYVDNCAISQKDDRFQIDATKINPLARLGAAQYIEVGEVFSLTRPK